LSGVSRAGKGCEALLDRVGAGEEEGIQTKSRVAGSQAVFN